MVFDSFKAALKREDFDGVILRGFGPGNPPAHLAEVMERVWAVKSCVMASLIDGPQHEDYAVGNSAIQLGMLPAGESPYYEAAQRLDCLLGITKDLSEIRDLCTK